MISEKGMNLELEQAKKMETAALYKDVVTSLIKIGHPVDGAIHGAIEVVDRYILIVE